MTKKLPYNWRVQRANDKAARRTREYRVIHETGRSGRYDYYVAEVTLFEGKIYGIGPIVSTYDDFTEDSWDEIQRAMKQAYSKPILEWKTIWQFKDVEKPKKGIAEAALFIRRKK